MATLRVQRTARVLSQIVPTTTQRFSPIQCRFESSASKDPASKLNQDSRLVTQEESRHGLVDHPIDVNMHVDHATSYVFLLVWLPLCAKTDQIERSRQSRNG